MQDADQTWWCLCACTIHNSLTHTELSMHPKRAETQGESRQHDQILNIHVRKTDAVLTALFHLLAVPCSNEVLPDKKSAIH